MKASLEARSMIHLEILLVPLVINIEQMRMEYGKRFTMAVKINICFVVQPPHLVKVRKKMINLELYQDMLMHY